MSCTNVRVNLVSGSIESLMFLQNLESLGNSDVFLTKFVMNVLDLKMHNIWWVAMFELILFFFYFVTLLITTSPMNILGWLIFHIIVELI